MIETRLKVKVDTPGLLRGAEAYAEEYIRTFQSVLPTLQTEVRALQREDTGDERERTKFRIITRGKANFILVGNLYNTSIQAAVDETGAKPHFPPWRKGSKLFRWTQRKGLGQDVSKGEASYIGGAVARSVGQRLGAGAVKEHNLDVDKQVERVSFRIALKQSRSGLPRAGDVLRSPMNTVTKARTKWIEEQFRIATDRATTFINNLK